MYSTVRLYHNNTILLPSGSIYNIHIPLATTGLLTQIQKGVLMYQGAISPINGYKKDDIIPQAAI